MNQNNKRATIVSLHFYPIVESTIVRCYPGRQILSVTGMAYSFRPQSAEFKETLTQGSDEVSQQFSAIITDVSLASSAGMRRNLSLPGLLLMIYSNSEKRVVGTDQFPVMITLEESGRPAQFKLSFKRTSPEPSKFFQSF